MGFIEVVFTTKYGNFIMRFYKEGMFSEERMGIYVKSFLPIVKR